MDIIKNGWFSEVNDLWPGLTLSLQVENVIYKGKSEFQDILILDTKACGKVLVLDGIIQCSELDEFSYQEMISFLPLFSHPNPKKVLIVGGGDGGVAREVCKHASVVEVSQVEIDQMVIDLCKQYLPKMAVGLSHPKLKLYVEDGFKFMEKHQNEFDVIITDSSDPVGPAIPLFQNKYYELMKSALKPGGIVCSQVGTPWTNLDIVCNTFKICKDTFPIAAYGFTTVPTYPTGQIGFVLGSLNKDTNFRQPQQILSKQELNKMNLRYYSSDVHSSAFVVPKFVEDALKNVI